MIPLVVGLPLEEALHALEAAGAAAAEIERAVVPADFRSRGPEDTRRKIEYVAAQRELPGGALRLRVVSVPAEPKGNTL
jgi:hypothetical protein